MTPNQLAFTALCNEYCAAVEHAADTDRADFIASMLRLLPRIYISANDLPEGAGCDAYIDDALDEDYYDSVRLSLIHI